MTVRAVEWKKPYTWGTAIEITEDKVINLLLREANNLLQVNGNNELFCDLQLDDELRPTDDFPVGVTTWRIVIDNWWDWEWTILCAKTTSWDNIKLVYTDAWEIYVDNGTGTFTRMYKKPEVDALLALKQDVLTAWDNITIDQDNVISANVVEVGDTAPSNPATWKLWFDDTNGKLWIYDGTQWQQITLTTPV